MKTKDMKNEIKVLDIAALIAKSKALGVEINDLVLDKNMDKLKDLKSISKKKKELARILTALNQKQLIASLEPKAVKEEKAEEKAKNKQSLRSEDLGKGGTK